MDNWGFFTPIGRVKKRYVKLLGARPSCLKRGPFLKGKDRIVFQTLFHLKRAMFVFGGVYLKILVTGNGNDLTLQTCRSLYLLYCIR